MHSQRNSESEGRLSLFYVHSFLQGLTNVPKGSTSKITVALDKWAEYLTGLASEPEQKKGQVATLT